MLTTQSQNCYREQIQKEMLTRLAWKSRYAGRYPTCCDPPDDGGGGGVDPTWPPGAASLASNLPAVLPPVTRATEKQSGLPPPPPPLPPPPRPLGPLMRPVSPQTRRALYQESSHHGKGRSLYLQKRGHMRPEEKFDFPLLSSWEYGWRLGDYTLDYGTPSRAKSSVVKNTFYARNGVFGDPAATDTLG